MTCRDRHGDRDELTSAIADAIAEANTATANSSAAGREAARRVLEWGELELSPPWMVTVWLPGDEPARLPLPPPPVWLGPAFRERHKVKPRPARRCGDTGAAPE